MNLDPALMLRALGAGQLPVLSASALVPFKLDWKGTLRGLPPLVRQLFWVYGGYVVLTIVSLGFVCLLLPEELSRGTPLSRAVCGFGALFWGIRLTLQGWLQVEPYLTAGWLRWGHRALTAAFATFTVIYAWVGFAA